MSNKELNALVKKLSKKSAIELQNRKNIVDVCRNNNCGKCSKCKERCQQELYELEDDHYLGEEPYDAEMEDYLTANDDTYSDADSTVNDLDEIEGFDETSYTKSLDEYFTSIGF